MDNNWICCKQENKTEENNNKGMSIIMVGLVLDNMSRTFTFFNPNNGSLLISNIVTWSDFKTLQAANKESEVESLIFAALEIKKEQFEIPDI